jgi:hypothetical protein
MSGKNHFCCLIFVEMSARGNMHFSQKFDCIKAFDDLGGQGRTSNIANHALAFMDSGLHKKWKQPVAYYFSCGSIKAEMIVQLLSKVLDACQSAGL